MTDDKLKNLSSKPVGDEIVRNNGVDNSIILTGRIVYVSLLVHEPTLYRLKLYNKHNCYSVIYIILCTQVRFTVKIFIYV